MAVNAEVRGILLKWTNYWGGWKQRWFVLKKGVLAYYNDEEEEEKGCKASINVSAADINVFSNDKTRFDITVQNEQHWCLKAKSSIERQSWLIAIATAKAGKEKGHLPIEGNNENSAKLKLKISELKLYTDLIANQVLEIKKEASGQTIDHAKLSDVSGMLTATCDTFLGTLDQCINLAESKFSIPLKPGYANNSSAPSIQRQSSNRSHLSSTPTTPTAHTPNKTFESANVNGSGDVFQDSCDTASSDFNKNAIPKIKKVSESSHTSENVMGVYKPATLFASMPCSFKDIILEPDGGIPTSAFLSACSGIIPFFDSIGSTAFAPVKMDVNGNIKKIRTKYLTDVSRYSVLQKIIYQEINMKTTKVRNSATDALLWLKRGLAFIYHFLLHIKDGEKDIHMSLNDAYDVSLKQYHGWVVKGVFALAVKAAPHYDGFMRAISTKVMDETCPDYKAALARELDEYLTAMEVVITIIDNFYQKYDLDDASVV